MSHKIDCFDCYITGVAQGEHTGSQVEQERIINLLRTELGPYLIWADDTPYIKGINLDGFIALIKASQNDNKTVSLLTEGESK